MHMQRMLKMSRGYTLAEILSKIFVKKTTKENWVPYLRSWFDKLKIWCQLIFLSKYVYFAITACMTYTFTFGKLTNREMVDFSL